MKLGYFILGFIFISLSLVLGSTLSLSLNKNNYAPGNLLDGVLVLNLSGPLDLGDNPKLKIFIGSLEEEAEAVKVLSGLDPGLKISKNILNATNPNTQKQLNLGENSFFGFRLLKGSIIENLDFDIEGVNSGVNYPIAPYLDFDNDDVIEWRYVSSFLGWSNLTTKIDGLSTNTGSEFRVQDNSYLHCGLMNLPFSNIFNFSIDLNVQDNSGNVSLYVLDFNKATLNSGGVLGRCSLNNNLGSGYKNCILNTTFFIQGNHLICFFNEREQGKYYLAIDDQGESRYRCDSSILDSENVQCEFLDDGDLFIKSYKPLYQGNLDKKVRFSDYSYVEGLIPELNTYLENCEEVGNKECALNFKAGSENNNGLLKLSNLNLEYTKPNKIPTVLRNFFDIIKTTSRISGVDNGILDKYTLNIPLSVFDNSLVIPNISGNLKIKTQLNGLTDEKTILVSKTSFVETNFSNSKKNLEGMNNDKTKEFLLVSGIDIETTLTTLNNYEIQINSINKDLILSFDEKKLRIDQLKSQADQLLSNIPKSVVILEDVDYLRNYPESIEINLLDGEKEEEILALQDDVDITTKVRLVNVYDSLGVKTEKTFIKRTLNSDLESYSIIEDIPKEIVDNANEIVFGNKNFEIINSDPIIKWDFNGKGEISYIVDGNALEKLNEIKTIVLVKSQKEEVQEPESNCGDGVCTEILEDELSCPADCKPKYKINWFVTIILLIILIFGLLYFNFVMGKRKLKDLVKRKPKFDSYNDEKNLKAYIQKNILKNIPKATIYKVLLSKKWSKEQIDYCFNNKNKFNIFDKMKNLLNLILVKIKRK